MSIKVNVNGFWLKGRVNGRGWIQMIQTESRWLGQSSQSGIGDQVCNCAVTWWLLVNILTYVRRSLRFVQWRMIQHEWTGLMELTARLGFYPSNGLLIGGKLPLLVESWQEQTGAENLNIEVSCVTVKNRAAAGSAKFFFLFFFDVSWWSSFWFDVSHDQTKVSRDEVVRFQLQRCHALDNSDNHNADNVFLLIISRFIPTIN